MFGKILKSIFGALNHFGTGALPDPVDARKIALASFDEPVALPDEFETELGKVFNQGSKGCCVGCAIVGVANKKLDADLSYDDLYDECKKKDGIPNVSGTYPTVGAKQIVDVGVASVEAFNSKDPVKIAESRSKNKLGGYAYVGLDFDSVCQAIYKHGMVTGAFLISSDWYRKIITKVLSSIGGHYVILKGFKISTGVIKGRNSWGIGWVGYIAGIFNKNVKEGEFEMLWEDYKGMVYDIIAFTTIPPQILEDAKKYDYRFMNTLKYGMTSYEVKKLQERLGVNPTGFFGNLTRNAVQTFQYSNGLQADGIVGEATRKVLNKNAVSYIPLWAKAIQTHEGYYKGSRSYRNNNPANFKVGSTLTSFIKTLGATGIDKDGYCIFPSYEVGFKALTDFLKMACEDKLLRYRGNMTLTEFFSVYAPYSDNNNPLAYAKAVAKEVGATVNTKIRELL